jgi:hypothetical protein
MGKRITSGVKRTLERELLDYEDDFGKFVTMADRLTVANAEIDEAVTIIGRDKDDRSAVLQAMRKQRKNGFGAQGLRIRGDLVRLAGEARWDAELFPAEEDKHLERSHAFFTLAAAKPEQLKKPMGTLAHQQSASDGRSAGSNLPATDFRTALQAQVLQLAEDERWDDLVPLFANARVQTDHDDDGNLVVYFVIGENEVGVKVVADGTDIFGHRGLKEVVIVCRDAVAPKKVWYSFGRMLARQHMP